MSPARPLPPDANLRQLKNQAKDLRRACENGDADALRRLGEAHPRFAGKSAGEIAATPIALADAQLVIARELGFRSWPNLKRNLESPSQPATTLHELVTGHDLQTLQQAVVGDPASVNRLNDSGLPPLYTAALYRNWPAVTFLLEQGAVVDIFACAYLGKATEAERLLAQRPELARATTPNGMTALHYAAQAGHLDVCDVLLRYRSELNAVDQTGTTPLAAASHAGPWKAEPAEDIVQLLLDHGARIDLFLAAALGRTDLIASLLDRDSSLIDQPDDRGRTALFHASRNNRLAAVKLLVERGADVNRSDAVGIAALHRTSQECSDELIQYLIDHGAQAHLCCHVACGDETGTRRLLARHPETVHERYYEFNAVEYAIHCWQLGTLRILLEHGCKLSAEDQQHILRIGNNNHELLQELVAIHLK